MSTAKPFRADHVGSLLRTPELKAARDQFARKEISRDQLRSAEDAAVRHVVNDVRMFCQKLVCRDIAISHVHLALNNPVLNGLLRRHERFRKL